MLFKQILILKIIFYNPDPVFHGGPYSDPDSFFYGSSELDLNLYIFEGQIRIHRSV